MIYLSSHFSLAVSMVGGSETGFVWLRKILRRHIMTHNKFDFGRKLQTPFIFPRKKVLKWQRSNDLISHFQSMDWLFLFWNDTKGREMVREGTCYGDEVRGSIGLINGGIHELLPKEIQKRVLYQMKLPLPPNHRNKETIMARLDNIFVRDACIESCLFPKTYFRSFASRRDVVLETRDFFIYFREISSLTSSPYTFEGHLRRKEIASNYYPKLCIGTWSREYKYQRWIRSGTSQ